MILEIVFGLSHATIILASGMDSFMPNVNDCNNAKSPVFKGTELIITIFTCPIFFKKLSLGKLNIIIIIEKVELILTGNQKSGTTAIAALLGKVTKKKVMLDNEAFWYPMSSFIINNHLDFKKVAESALKEKYEILKEPNFCFFFDKVLDFFGDDCKYVFIVRDPRQNVRSLLERFQIPGNLSMDQMASRFPQISSSHIFTKDFNFGHPHYVGKLSERWLKAVMMFEKNRDHFHLVRYEDFLIDKAKFIKKLALDLNLISDGDITSDVDKQYQPKGKFQNKLELFYGENYDIIQQVCGNKMAYFGYN